jgi:hypothetical protein
VVVDDLLGINDPHLPVCTQGSGVDEVALV